MMFLVMFVLIVLLYIIPFIFSYNFIKKMYETDEWSRNSLSLWDVSAVIFPVFNLVVTVAVLHSLFVEKIKKWWKNSLFKDKKIIEEIVIKFFRI